jgi:Trm5-related predicted tRNA methylase
VRRASAGGIVDEDGNARPTDADQLMTEATEQVEKLKREIKLRQHRTTPQAA